jgi:hypothetical protein
MRTQWVVMGLASVAMAVGCADARKTEEALTPAPAADTATPTGAQPAASASPAAAQPSVAGHPANGPGHAAAARPAPPAAPPAPRIEYRTVSVPAGTGLSLELLTALSSATAKVETPVRARLKEAVKSEGYTVFPADTELTGSVTEVQHSGRVKGLAHLAFVFTEATVAGTHEKLRTAPIAVDAKSTKGKDAAVIGLGAGIGAVIGGIADGGSGAAKGAAIGGGGGTGVVLATKGEEVTLAAGADLTTTLADAYEMKVRVK